ncbi:hypothetical protein [Shinella fusca]|uniref:DUF1508 domain-containing protein n=1 Tax=Shinella fusca TaxID=544480 RepID=A0A7W7YXM9_9HYPH|nr:hypothetical protein [Shinella fusca]MBB5044114.1 hypothetical protein [Shinella fusca]
MAADKEKPASKVTVQKDRKGQYFFALTFRGVTYPVKGPFANPMQAAAAGQAVLKGLEAQAEKSSR